MDDPILRPSLNSVRMTYDLAQMPEYQDLMTAVSPRPASASTASPTSIAPPRISGTR